MNAASLAARPSFLVEDLARATEGYRRSALAGFLRMRRARLAPDPAWPVVDASTPRRVPGLRREEMAWAAELSVEYYTKLEQGRAANPSSAVVSSLSAALRLSDLDRRYLNALTAPLSAVAVREDAESVRVAESTLRALGAQLREPVMLHLLTHDLTIRAIDARTAAVLFPGGRATGAEGRDVSLLDYIFTDPISRTVYVDWAEKAGEVVGLAHLSLATTAATAELLETLARLWDTSSAFRYLWARYEPFDKARGTWRLRLPDGAVATCEYSTVQTPSCREISLVTYRRAEPDPA